MMSVWDSVGQITKMAYKHVTKGLEQKEKAEKAWEKAWNSDDDNVR